MDPPPHLPVKRQGAHFRRFVTRCSKAAALRISFPFDFPDVRNNLRLQRLCRM